MILKLCIYIPGARDRRRRNRCRQRKRLATFLHAPLRRRCGQSRAVQVQLLVPGSPSMLCIFYNASKWSIRASSERYKEEDLQHSHASCYCHWTHSRAWWVRTTHKSSPCVGQRCALCMSFLSLLHRWDVDGLSGTEWTSVGSWKMHQEASTLRQPCIDI